MNIVILKGNLTKDPASRKVATGDGKETTVTNFTVATNRFFTRRDGTKDKEVTFLDCEAWDSGAETIQKYVKKGYPILVEGSLKLDTWETDGQKRSKVKVRVKSFELLHSAPKSTDSTDDTSGPESEPDTDPASDGGDIPF